MGPPFQISAFSPLILSQQRITSCNSTCTAGLCLVTQFGHTADTRNRMRGHHQRRHSRDSNNSLRVSHRDGHIGGKCRLRHVCHQNSHTADGSTLKSAHRRTCRPLSPWTSMARNCSTARCPDRDCLWNCQVLFRSGCSCLGVRQILVGPTMGQKKPRRSIPPAPCPLDGVVKGAGF